MIIDCDPGHDDAVAILLAHRQAEVLAITTVSGNASLDNTTRNALHIVELMEAEIPVHSGAAGPLVGDAVHAGHVHGPSGLGGVSFDDPRLEVAGTAASEYLVAAARETPDLWIVAIGPLTNLAHAIRLDPEFASRIAGISIMGGSADVGNVTRVAEFNIWADPEAADVVFRSGARLKMCGLNLTHQLKTDDALIDELRATGGPVPHLVAELFDYLHERMADLVGERRAALHDPCAVLAVTRPDLVRFEPRAVDIEVEGTLTRGMTVLDQRTTRKRDPANVEVAYEIDAAVAMREIVEALGGY